MKGVVWGGLCRRERGGGERVGEQGLAQLGKLSGSILRRLVAVMRLYMYACRYVYVFRYVCVDV